MTTTNEMLHPYTCVLTHARARAHTLTHTHERQANWNLQYDAIP